MTRPHDSTAADDPSFVPGFEPELPLPRTESGALDPAFDPDRFDADLFDAGAASAPVSGRLDPTLDPDRYHPDPARRNPDGQTLPELLGAGAFEEPRDNWAWALGLVSVLVFLALVSWFFGAVVKY